MVLNLLSDSHFNAFQSLHCIWITVVIEDFGNRLEVCFKGLLLVWVHDFSYVVDRFDSR